MIPELIVLINSVATMAVDACPTRSIPIQRPCVRSRGGIEIVGVITNVIVNISVSAMSVIVVSVVVVIGSITINSVIVIITGVSNDASDGVGVVSSGSVVDENFTSRSEKIKFDESLIKLNIIECLTSTSLHCVILLSIII